MGNGASSVQIPTATLPDATRGGGHDPVKKWFDDERKENADLFSTINLQCFQSNVKTATSKWYNRAHNPENGSNPPPHDD